MIDKCHGTSTLCFLACSLLRILGFLCVISVHCVYFGQTVIPLIPLLL